MADKTLSPGLKAALEYGPLLVLFAGILLLRGQTFHLLGADRSGLVVMTLVFVPLQAVTTFLQWRLSGELSVMQVITLLVVIVMGGLTIWLNDERFFKMKPTLIYLLFAGILGVGLLRGKSYLQFALGKTLPMKPEGWMILTKRMAYAFVALALANEVVWRTMSTPIWVTFKTFGLTGLLFVFILSQARLLTAYGEDPTEK